ncbi:MAG: 3-deoxy-manno-octulosonate cytidylyltransferase [Nitrospirales bacterium]
MPKATGGVTVVIPARYGSSRFPGKPLARLKGQPVIQHVYERVRSAAGIDRVIVATDDERIAATVRGFGGTVIVSQEPFRTGTDRVAAVASQYEGEVFVNVQGDEIVLHADLLRDLVDPFVRSGAPMGTLKRRFASGDAVRNPGAVKVVTDREGWALYFSRAPIPHVREATAAGSVAPPGDPHFLHLGIYGYTRETLLRLAALPPGVLEEAEQLEQLRALEHGINIRVWETRHPSLRIDTPEDLAEAERTLQAGVPC